MASVHTIYRRTGSNCERPIIVNCAVAIVYMHKSKPYTDAITEYIAHMKCWNAIFWLHIKISPMAVGVFRGAKFGWKMSDLYFPS